MMTAEQFWEWLSHQDDGDRRFELHDGEVVEFPLMGEKHGVVCSWLSFLLGKHLIERRSGWVATNNCALLVARQPDTLLGPDLMALELSKSTRKLSNSFCTRIPDLAVEVLAPEDARPTLSRRIERYLGRGVPLVWAVDPDARTVAVFRPGKKEEVLQGQEVLTGEGSLAGLRIPVADVFRLPGGSMS
jgi:Uma2 family endonuclease